MGVAPAGDVNADGFDDLWAGLSPPGSTGSELYLVFGGPEGLPPDEADPAGVAVVSWVLGGWYRGHGRHPGDYDGDGTPDLLEFYTPDKDRNGHDDDDPSYLALLGGPVGFLGGSDFDAYPHTLYDMYTTEVVSGLPVNVGDLDGDGADEIAVTAHEATGPLDSLAIVSGLDLAAGGGVFSTLAVRSAITTTEYHHLDLTAPSLGANTDANGDGYDDLEVGVSFNDTDFGALLYTSGGIPEGPLEAWTHTRVENIRYAGRVLVRDSDVDGDEVADPVLWTNCLLPTTRMRGGGTLDYETIAGPCLGQYAGALRYTSAFTDMTGDGFPEWVIADIYGGEDGNNRVLIVEGFPIPWDDPSKW
jgi:hypothetical protein